MRSRVLMITVGTLAIASAGLVAGHEQEHLQGPVFVGEAAFGTVDDLAYALSEASVPALMVVSEKDFDRGGSRIWRLVPRDGRQIELGAALNSFVSAHAGYRAETRHGLVVVTGPAPEAVEALWRTRVDRFDASGPLYSLIDDVQRLVYWQRVARSMRSTALSFLSSSLTLLEDTGNPRLCGAPGDSTRDSTRVKTPNPDAYYQPARCSWQGSAAGCRKFTTAGKGPARRLRAPGPLSRRSFGGKPTLRIARSDSLST